MEEKINELDNRVRELERRADVSKAIWGFITTRWAFIIVVLGILLGLYEGAQYLYHLPPPIK